MGASAFELLQHSETGVPLTLAARLPALRPFFKDARTPGWAPNVRMLNSPAWFEAMMGDTTMKSDFNQVVLDLFDGNPRDAPLPAQYPASVLGGGWLADAGRGLLRLLATEEPLIQVHMVCGDVHEAAASIASQGRRQQERGLEEPLPPLPRRFHRISLSNVPDYTTMLPAFVHLLPLLAPWEPGSKVQCAGVCLSRSGGLGS
jgi:hypothetical protein